MDKAMNQFLVEELDKHYHRQILADVKTLGNIALEESNNSWAPALAIKLIPVKL